MGWRRGSRTESAAAPAAGPLVAGGIPTVLRGGNRGVDDVIARLRAIGESDRGAGCVQI